jgi:hypothetical protein
MTPEQIEEMRPKRIDDELNEHMNALCDLALKGLQVEAMREAIVLNVGRMRNDMKMRGYLSVGTLTSALDDLSQSLNPKNEEGKTAAAPDELRKAYFEGYEDALKDRAAPAEVAEGAGRPSWDKIISDLRDVVSKLPAAPSLSREELEMIDYAVNRTCTQWATPDPKWEALRAKVSKNAK